MATLSAIGFTVAAGLSVFSVAMVSFGTAVRHQSPFIAARCEARPRTVVHNPDDREEGGPQNRGSPMWGWIPWVMKLTYATMLSGVPGTGTRDGGLSGLMLKVNLDGIILLRFHHLCLRVSTMAAFLYIVVVLPIFKTFQCSRIGGDYDTVECQQQNLTDYQRLTLANIPPLQDTTYDTFWDLIAGFFLPVHGGLLARLYGVVFVAWAVTLYAYTELEQEWRDVLALRRVYFLEADHWSDRNAELAETLMRREQERADGLDGHSKTRSDSNDTSYMRNRDPWVPHPEQRDTVPNIQLYSVLVGGLPSLPTEAFVSEEVEAVFSRKQSIDWQLAVTTAFFDHCVPNQPGFSSSVAAVTILPAASQITEAWNHWYKAAAKLRRLRFIRRQIAKVKAREFGQSDGSQGPASNHEGHDIEKGGYGSGGASSDSEQRVRTKTQKSLIGRKKESKRTFRRKKKKRKSSVYSESEEKMQYNREVLGATDELDVENNLLNALRLGPEQTAVYSREFAQGAAPLAPYGWNEQKVRKASLPELLEMEKKAAHDVQVANKSLRRAQEKIAEHSSDDNVSDDNLAKYMRNTRDTSPSDNEDNRADDLEAGTPSTFDEETATPPKSESSNQGDNILSRPKQVVTSNAVESSSGGFSFEANDVDSSSLRTTTPFKGVPRNDIADSSKCVSFLSSLTPKFDLVDNLFDQSLQLVDNSTRHFGSVASQIFLPERRGSNQRAFGSRRSSRGSLASSQLPSDLGLEAGLFLEQRKLSRGQLQHISRCSVPKRSKSTDDLPELKNPGFRKTKTEELSKSTDHRSRLPKTAPPRRNKSYDGIDSMQELVEDDEWAGTLDHSSLKLDLTPNPFMKTESGKKSLSAEATPSVSIHDDEEAELRLKLGYEDPETKRKVGFGSNHFPDNQQGGVATMMQPNATLTSTTSEGQNRKGSIWDKIASENDRRSKLRNRLSSVRSSLKSSIAPDQGMQPRGVSFSSNSQDPISLDSSATPRPPRKLDFSTPNSPTKHVNFQPSDGERRTAGYGDGSRMFAIREMNDSESSRVSMDVTEAAGGDDLLTYNPLEMSKTSFSSHACVEDNLRLARDFEEKAGLRQRQCNGAMERLSKSTNEKWTQVIQVVKETSIGGKRNNANSYIDNGSWSGQVPTIGTLFESFLFSLKHIFKPLRWGLQTADLVDHLASESHYAVVTFTSRQAAVAARQCLADSRGSDRWVTVNEMPAPPLADAPVFSTSGTRGCVRPVTISINDKQKMIRHLLALIALGSIYFFYTFPLTRAQQAVSPETLGKVIPDLDVWLENSFLRYMFLGFIPALVWTAFFAICPPLFKVIANFGSNASSSAIAEGSAMKYFWWFMVVSAFTGTSLASALIDGFASGIQIGAQAQNVIVASAAAIPNEVSATWLNWMIVRLTMVLPTQYLLQLNSFLFTWLGLKCCARAARGGGSGGPVPYRIYIDSGVVMLCLFALAPASPLIAMASFMYFLVCVPVLRWTMIFLYKPKYDIGGKRFPFIFDMCVSGMIVGQILLGTMMTLRRAFGPAVAAFVPIFPTIVYRWILRGRYLRAFDDVALLQTSLLDGWDTNEETSLSKREEFRQFLVDCHKAAYVPVCIASDQGTLITSEPAVALPLDYDNDEDFDDMASVNGDSVMAGSVFGGASVQSDSMFGTTGSILGGGGGSAAGKIGSPLDRNPVYHPYQPMQQPGMMMRRTTASANQMRMVHEQMMSHIEIHGDNSFGHRTPPTSPTRSPRKLAFSSPRHGQPRPHVMGSPAQRKPPSKLKSITPPLPENLR